MTSLLTWSNVVLTAILPHISEFSARLNLPIPQPITTAQVWGFLPDCEGKVEGIVCLTNGYRFRFEDGYIREFNAPSVYRGLQDPDQIPRYFGEIRLDKDEAIAAARGVLRSLGLSEERLYANFEPRVDLPPTVKNHRIARYEIAWVWPHASIPSVEMEIDASSGKVLMIHMLHHSLEKPDPVVNVPAPAKLAPDPLFPKINDEAEKQAILQRAIPLINEAIERLHLKLAKVNTAKGVQLTGTGSGSAESRIRFHATVVLTDGFEFSFLGFTDKIVLTGFSAPDYFFGSSHDVDVKAFLGARKVANHEAIKLAEGYVKKFNPRIELSGKPKLGWPNLPSNITVPRCMVIWSMDSWYVAVEVDLESGTVKSLYACE
jgi:hypothetical protein